MHFYIANRVGWEHLSMFSTFSPKFIIRFFDLVNCLVLLHRIFNTLRLINYYVIFQKYFTEYHNYNSRKTYFPSTYPSIESPFSFFFHIQFLNSNNSNPKQYPKHQTIVLPIIYTLFLPYIYISIQLNNWFLWKFERNESPLPQHPHDSRSISKRSYLSRPSINQEQANRWQSRNLEWPALHPRKPPPVAVTLGQGKDARPSLMQLHHFMRAPIGSRCTSR